MVNHILPTERIDGHLSQLDIQKYILNSTTQPAVAKHLDECELCQAEFTFILEDMATADAVSIPLIDQVRIFIGGLTDGFKSGDLAGAMGLRMVPQMRDREREEALLTLTRLIYHGADFLKVQISRPSKSLGVKITPLTKFKTQRSFFLYNNGTRKETIALKGRQSGTFNGIEPGIFEIYSGDESIFRLIISTDELIEDDGE